MKKLTVLVLTLVGFALSTQAQETSKNALGFRLGSNYGFGAEISYQRALEKNNRLEADLGWQNKDKASAFRLTGIYQWVWKINNRLDWYAGGGAGLGCWDAPESNGVFAYVTGDIGIDYNFKAIPFAIALDYRPEIGGNSYFSTNYRSNVALAVRYKF